MRLGTTKFTDKRGRELKYDGYVDKEGKACGDGVSTKISDPNVTFKGTYLDNKYHGLVYMYNAGNGHIGVTEWRNGQEHG